MHGPMDVRFVEHVILLIILFIFAVNLQFTIYNLQFTISVNSNVYIFFFQMNFWNHRQTCCLLMFSKYALLNSWLLVSQLDVNVLSSLLLYSL